MSYPYNDFSSDADELRKSMARHYEEARRNASKSAARFDPRVWTTDKGILMHVADMNTSHLINCVAMIARTRMKRQHGIIDSYELNSLSEERLNAHFEVMMRELDGRRRRKRRSN